MPFKPDIPRNSRAPVIIRDDAGYTAATITRTGSTWTATGAGDNLIATSSSTRSDCTARTLKWLEHLTCTQCTTSFSTSVRLRIHQARRHKD